MSKSHGKNIISDDIAAKHKPKLRAGDIVRVCGDAAELWIAGYNVRVDTYATVDAEPSKGAKKVLVTLDRIDGDSKVCTYVRRSKVKVEFNIVRATFGSVWDGGEVVETPCMVNLETKEVFNIEMNQDCNDLDVLEKEFVEINGVEYPVFQNSDITEEDNEYWYDV